MEHCDSSVEPTWFTREETARILERNVKTVDRLRAKGILVDLDNTGMVRICRRSIENYLRRPVEVKADPAGVMTIEQAHYDTLLRTLHHYQAAAEKVDELERKLEFSQAECERLRQKIRELLADRTKGVTLVRNVFGMQVLLVKNASSRSQGC